MKIRNLLLPLPWLLAACTPAAPPPTHAGAEHVAHPGLWKVADADTTIYLFGTIHVLPKDYAWESARLRDVVAKSDELVIETVIGKDPQASAAMLLGMGRASGLPPLVDRVPPKKRAALQGIIARRGLPPKLLDGMKPWTAALLLGAWSRGDQRAIAASFDKDPEMTPKLRGILIDRRNAAWTGWLQARLAKPGTVLVAVGAGHLAGPGSVPERLKAQGLTVTRVE